MLCYVVIKLNTYTTNCPTNQSPTEGRLTFELQTWLCKFEIRSVRQPTDSNFKMISRSAWLKSRGGFAKTTTRYLLSGHGGDKILPATSFTCWDSHEPVNLRMEDKAPGNYPPILVQTMVRNAVKKFGSSTAIVSFDGKTRWTYDEYLDQIQTVAKGFIDIGLQPSHAVGIMSNNCPQWFTSRFAIVCQKQVEFQALLPNSKSN